MSIESESFINSIEIMMSECDCLVEECKEANKKLLNLNGGDFWDEHKRVCLRFLDLKDNIFYHYYMFVLVFSECKKKLKEITKEKNKLNKRFLSSTDSLFYCCEQAEGKDYYVGDNLVINETMSNLIELMLSSIEFLKTLKRSAMMLPEEG